MTQTGRPEPPQSPGTAGVIAVQGAADGAQLCALGYHAWVPWLQREQHWVTWCTRCRHQEVAPL
jgi:hypothetical protein